MNTFTSQLESMRSKMNERRKSLEQVRSFNVRRLQTDVKKITKQEIEFSKKLLEQIVPVKIVWNDDVAKRLREMVPFTVELHNSAEVADAANAAEGEEPASSQESDPQ